MIDEYINLKDEIETRLDYILQLLGDSDLDNLRLPYSSRDHQISVFTAATNVHFIIDWTDPYDKIGDTSYELFMPVELFESGSDDEIISYFIDEDKYLERTAEITDLRTLVTLLRANKRFQKLLQGDVWSEWNNKNNNDLSSLYDILSD